MSWRGSGKSTDRYSDNKYFVNRNEYFDAFKCDD